MTTQPVIGTLCMTDNTEIPLILALTDGTASEVTTDPAFTVSSQSVGDYAPGKTIRGAMITAKTFIGYAYTPDRVSYCRRKRSEPYATCSSFHITTGRQSLGLYPSIRR